MSSTSVHIFHTGLADDKKTKITELGQVPFCLLYRTITRPLHFCMKLGCKMHSVNRSLYIYFDFDSSNIRAANVARILQKYRQLCVKSFKNNAYLEDPSNIAG